VRAGDADKAQALVFEEADHFLAGDAGEFRHGRALGGSNQLTVF
jgi:hypothetical protein